MKVTRTLKVFKSNYFGQEVAMEDMNGYYEMSELHIILGYAEFDEESAAYENELSESGFPWIIRREDENGIVRVVGFKTIDDAIDYIAENADAMKKNGNSYLPNGSLVDDDDEIISTISEKKISDSLEDKIQELFYEMQEEYGIKNGVVGFQEAFDMEELQNKLAKSIKAVLEFQKLLDVREEKWSDDEDESEV